MNTCCITIEYIEEDVDEYLLYNISHDKDFSCKEYIWQIGRGVGLDWNKKG